MLQVMPCFYHDRLWEGCRKRESVLSQPERPKPICCNLPAGLGDKGGAHWGGERNVQTIVINRRPENNFSWADGVMRGGTWRDLQHLRVRTMAGMVFVSEAQLQRFHNQVNMVVVAVALGLDERKRMIWITSGREEGSWRTGAEGQCCG